MNQEVLHNLWNQTVSYLVYNSQPLVPHLSQIKLVNALSARFFKIRFHIIFLSVPRSSKWSLSTRLPQETLCAFLFSPIHGTCLACLIILNLISIITHFGEENNLWCVLMRFSPDRSVIPTLNIFSPLSIRDQCSIPLHNRCRYCMEGPGENR